MNKKFEVFMVCCLLFSSFLLGRRGAALVDKKSAKTADPCIVIDAGHGMNDPGKIGVNNALEKDINLAVALKLAPLLENRGYRVVLTRTTDDILADPSSSNKKREDMTNRVRLISENHPLFTVSIHQNSYSDASVSGPQVFYYKNSSQGKEIAACVQNSLNNSLSPRSPRQIKANSDYYLLKKTPTPTIIIECGFLSNPTEAALLVDNNYQDKLARAIYLGLSDFLDSGESVTERQSR